MCSYSRDTEMETRRLIASFVKVFSQNVMACTCVRARVCVCLCYTQVKADSLSAPENNKIKL